MKKILITALLLAGISATAQVKIGDNPTVLDPGGSTLLEMESTTKGLLMPRMTTAQRTAIATPANGLQVFDTDTKSFWYFDATILPAPGAWVEGSSKGNEEWAYNGTDAIEAKRAKANSQVVAVLSANGAQYSNLGAFDYATMMKSPLDGVNPAWTAEPKHGLNNLFATSDALPTTSAAFSSINVGDFPFSQSYSTLTDAHITAAGAIHTGGLTYVNRRSKIETGATTGAIANLYNHIEQVDVPFNTSSNITDLSSGYDLLRNYGSGNVTTMIGNRQYTQNYGSGNVTTMIGNRQYTQNFGTGAITNFRALDISSNNTSAGSTPNNVLGVSIGTANASIIAPATGTFTISGVNNTTTNSGVAKAANMHGIYNSTSNTVTGGAFTNGYGILNNFTNSATSTDAITNLYGYLSTIQHNGASPITGNYYGQGVTTLTGTTATTGIPNTLIGGSYSTQLRTQQAGTSATIYGIQNVNINSSAVVTTNHYGYNASTSVSGSGRSNTLRGINNVITSNSTSADPSGSITVINNELTHSSTTNSVGQVIGTNNNLTISGKASGTIYADRNYTLISTAQGNSFSSLLSDYNYLYLLATSDASATNMYGSYIRNENRTTGLVSNQFGSYVMNVNYSPNTGVVTKNSGLEVQHEFGGAGAVGSNYGAFINNINASSGAGSITNDFGMRIYSYKHPSSTTVITNRYGLYVDAVAGATDRNYTLFTTGGNHYLGGNVGITDFTPVDRLSVLSSVNGLGVYRDYDATVSNAAVYFHLGARSGTDKKAGVRFVGGLYDAAVNGQFSIQVLNNDVMTQAFAVANDGRVLIGGSDPTTAGSRLDVQGYVKVASADTKGDATPTNGMIRYNSTTNKFQGYANGAWTDLQVAGLPVYANNAAAIAGGLAVGQTYHTGDGIVRVVF